MCSYYVLLVVSEKMSLWVRVSENECEWEWVWEWGWVNINLSEWVCESEWVCYVREWVSVSKGVWVCVNINFSVWEWMSVNECKWEWVRVRMSTSECVWMSEWMWVRVWVSAVDHLMLTPLNVSLACSKSVITCFCSFEHWQAITVITTYVILHVKVKVTYPFAKKKPS